MGMWKKAFMVLLVFAKMFIFGLLNTFLAPLGRKKNLALKNEAKQLSIDAAKKLDAVSVMVKLNSGLTLHVVEAGDRKGKLIILLHGFPDCWHSWSGVIPTLAKKGYFVVAPDMRGYNLSDKPQAVDQYSITHLTGDVKDLIDHYNNKTAVVVAHDWGGVVAWHFAEHYPEMIEKLVIINAPHGRKYQKLIRTNKSQMLSSWYILFFQIPLIPVNLITYNPFEAVRSFFITKNKNALSGESKKLLASAYVQDGAVPAMLNYYKSMFRAMAFGKDREGASGSRGKPQKLQTPTLVLWGEDDVALVPELAMCSEYVENVQVNYIPKCSHWVPYEAPEIVSRQIIDFLSHSRL